MLFLGNQEAEGPQRLMLDRCLPWAALGCQGEPGDSCWLGEPCPHTPPSISAGTAWAVAQGQHRSPAALSQRGPVARHRYLSLFPGTSS